MVRDLDRYPPVLLVNMPPRKILRAPTPNSVDDDFNDCDDNDTSDGVTMMREIRGGNVAVVDSVLDVDVDVDSNDNGINDDDDDDDTFTFNHHY